jgi:XTP/dITP diphosphohydrolase
MTGRRFTGGTLVLATHNQGKVDELVALLAPFGVSVKSASDFGLDAPEETETSFVGNARLKAHHVAQATGLPALADDSGIEIDVLGGAPGVYTADWAEGPGGRDFLRAMEKAWGLIVETGVAPPFSARFRCALVLAWPDGHEEVFEGAAEGQLVWPDLCGNEWSAKKPVKPSRCGLPSDDLQMFHVKHSRPILTGGPILHTPASRCPGHLNRLRPNCGSELGRHLRRHETKR